MQTLQWVEIPTGFISTVLICYNDEDTVGFVIQAESIYEEIENKVVVDLGCGTVSLEVCTLDCTTCIGYMTLAILSQGQNIVNVLIGIFMSST